MSQRERLAGYTTGASDTPVDGAAAEWRRCQQILMIIGQKIAGAGPGVQESIGGETGPAVANSFSRAATTMGGQAEEFALGASALTQAAGTIRSTNQVDQQIKANPLTPPTVPTRSPGPMTQSDVAAQQDYDSDRASYQQATASQEEAARTAADGMDDSYRDVIAVMKQIHGIPDPSPPGGAGGGGAASGGGGAGGGGGDGTSVGNPTVDEPVPDNNGDSGNGSTGGNGGNGGGDADGGGGGTGGGDGGGGGTNLPPVIDTGAPQGGGTTVGPPVIGGTVGPPAGGGGGAAGGLGGVGAGALVAGGVTGLSGSLSSALGTPVNGAGTGGGRGPIRSLGGSGRPGGPGTLGRGAGVLPATGANGTGTRGTRAGGGRGAAGAGTGGRGTGRAGGRGASGARGAGGRGVGAGAGAGGGRGGKKDRRRGGERDLFDDGRDWIDDEDLAPDVLD